jgi:hypothetical protein
MFWNRQVSPAHRRVQETQRENLMSLYRADMHRANWISGTHSIRPDRFGVSGEYLL